MDNEGYTLFNINKESIAEEILFTDESTEGKQVIIVEVNPAAIASLLADLNKRLKRLSQFKIFSYSS